MRGDNWGARNEVIRTERDEVIFTWMYLYKTYGYEKFKQVVTTIGSSGYKEKLEKIYGKSLDDIQNEFFNYFGIKKLKN